MTKQYSMQYQSLFRHLGNTLILASVVLFAYIASPVILEEWRFRQQSVQDVPAPSPEFTVHIPSLAIRSTVIENVNAWDATKYQIALKNGVAHASGSATPNQNGSMFLFAHSSDVPWRMTRTNTAFFRLPRIMLGERVLVDYQGERYAYEVSDIKEVWPHEVEAVTQAQGDQVILQTCTPVGTSLKRLLVFAKKVG
jgi:LPXTG-site transpeptidase (sortase) family protein